MKSKAAVKRIIETLKGIYPDALCSLQYEKDYELLFSVRLAAQCTDARVNLVTPALFARVDDVTITDRPDTDAMLAAIERGDADTLCANVRNVFEQALEGEQRERIETIKRDLLAYGAKTSAMTGSGSVVFGLFSDETSCRAACDALQSGSIQTFCTEFV